MPVFSLDERIFFPPPELANPDGILAIGGDLRPERLLLAYQMGIFPWFGEDEPLLWWSPDTRCILDFDQLKISKSMRQFLRKNPFRYTMDTAFDSVIEQCRFIDRKAQDSTWITHEMQGAYKRLHALGFAHSVEVWQEDKLVGGLYGVSIGRCFFGESMFSQVSNASKAALIHLVGTLGKYKFDWLDCQVYNRHLGSLGAREVPRDFFLSKLQQDVKEPSIRGKWSNL